VKLKESKRYFWYFGKRGRLSFEWIVRFAIALELQIGGGEGELFLLRVGLIFFTFYIGLDNWTWAKKLHLPDSDTRNTGFYIAREPGKPFGDFCLHIEIWQKMNEWRRGDWSWHFDLDRIFWGRKRHSSIVLEQVQCQIPMPEKQYAAVINIMEEQWRQRRKFWRPVTTIRRAHIEIPEGIPHPGKGTTSYNCDDDALMGMTTAVSTIEDAVKAVQKQAQWYRDNYPL
jgi:hypothetical protein